MYNKYFIINTYYKMSFTNYMISPSPSLTSPSPSVNHVPSPVSTVAPPPVVKKSSNVAFYIGFIAILFIAFTTYVYNNKDDFDDNYNMYFYIPLSGAILFIVLTIIFASMPLPNPPTNISVANGDRRVTISFTEVPGCTYSVISSASTNNITTGVSSPIVVTGLTNGQSYIFIITSSNFFGTSASSAPTTPITPIPIPPVPTSVTALSRNASSIVSFTSVGSNATSYVVKSTPGNITATGTTSPITVTGLTNGTSYTFKVRGVNAAGSSAESAASNAVVPDVYVDDE